MTALHNFIRATASYYGVPVDQLTDGCAVDSITGEFEVVLRFVLTPADLAGVGKRMEVMLREQAVDEAIAAKAQQTVQEVQGALSREAMRAQYNALPKAERSRHGSFGRFKMFVQTGIMPMGDVVDQLQTLAVEKAEIPAHVWVDGRELTNQQMALAMSSDARGRFAMDPADLTDEQRAKRGLQ